MDLQLQGRVVFVAGASRGIGRAIAEACLRKARRLRWPRAAGRPWRRPAPRSPRAMAPIACGAVAAISPTPG